jgi:hypothetical protein
MTTWYIDFEGYHFDNNYIVKEIAIVSKDRTRCYNYFVKSPTKMPHRPNTMTSDFQFNRHKLRWNCGDYDFMDAIRDIQLKVKNDDDLVLCKGAEKTKFLQSWLPEVEDMVWITTPFKQLYYCKSEVCEIKHGLNCARRKVHELVLADERFQKGQKRMSQRSS